MKTLRCTLRLRKRLRREVDTPDLGSTGVMGDWYGNVLSFGRVPHVIFVNQKSYLAFLLPLKPSATLIDRFREKAIELIGSLDGRSDLIECEQESFGEIRIGKTRDRAVVGTMNELSFQCRWRDQFRDKLDLDGLSALLHRVPCSKLKDCYPIDKARVLLGGDREDPSGRGDT